GRIRFGSHAQCRAQRLGPGAIASGRARNHLTQGTQSSQLENESLKPTNVLPRPKSRRSRVIPVVIFNVLAVLVLSEILLRVFDLPQIRLQPIDKRHGYLHDPELGWVGQPNSDGYMNASRPFHLHLNSLGLRDIEPAPAGGPTILFLGDSFVWGIDV